jgi:hypothetical protein
VHYSDDGGSHEDGHPMYNPKLELIRLHEEKEKQTYQFKLRILYCCLVFL